MDIGQFTFGGLASGLDTRAIVDAILKAERRPMERLQARQALFQQRRAALDEMRSKLGGFEDALRSLSSERTFRGRTATVSDASILRATPQAGAEAGLYSIEVLALAAAHKVKSDGFLAPDQGLVADGALTIKAGANDTITVNVSAASGNNSLDSIRDAINAADAGVKASVLYDGAAYRLVVRSEKTGLANALAITDGTGLNLEAAGNVVTAAADASLIVDGLAVTSSSNTVTDVIPGTTLDLLARTPSGAPVTLEVREDREGVVKAAQALVDAYNQVIDFFNTQFNRDNPGPLAGDPTARQIELKLQSLATGGIEGLPAGALRSLSAAGVSFDGKTGRMSLDTVELNKRLDDDFAGVARLFLATGTPSDSRVRFSSATSATPAGDYAVLITRAAEQAAVEGSVAVGGGGLGRDESLTVGLGSASATVALTSGMTITQIVDSANAALRSAGLAATASSDGGRLRFTTREFGSATAISVVSSQADPGDGSGSGFGTTAATDNGADVAGSIGGATAGGLGQLLTAAGDSPAAGLVLRITATPAEVVASGGDFGTLTYTRGIVRSLIAAVDDATRSGQGPIDAAAGALDAGIKALGEDVSRIEERLKLREATLVRMFAAAESSIQALQAQQAQLNSSLSR
ncbi:MAG TPA: flagellar filament capping protein FliD [Candidatus Polarisedimenticolia bacterium]|nr:flagellar filament capping protein FliD [Candidatus Polarisedimenticolia bacterium]